VGVKQTKPAEQLDSIQGIRAYAAIAVVLHHIAVFGVDGTWGVDLFFIISGFMMCYVTAESGDHFLLKRVIRVVPLYWAGTIGVFCVALLWPHLLHRSTDSIPALLKSLAFIPFDKGDGVIQPLLFLGWTMNYEMFFYAIFALSMAIHHAYRAWICSAILLVICTAGFLYSFETLVLEFFSDGIVFNFIVGIACYGIYVRSEGWRRAPHTADQRRLLAAVGICALAFLPCSGELVPEFGRVITQRVPAALCFLSLLLGLSNQRLPRPIVMIGDSSYSLYLFHPYVVFAFDRALHAFDELDLRSFVLAPIVIALCCFLAVMLYHRIEVPVQKRLRRILIDRRNAGSHRAAPSYSEPPVTSRPPAGQD
jgi:peptidoglycan/LPS O-acetylase OafA/YrhL